MGESFATGYLLEYNYCNQFFIIILLGIFVCPNQYLSNHFIFFNSGMLESTLILVILNTKLD